jgi:hypothetical protein
MPAVYPSDILPLPLLAKTREQPAAFSMSEPRRGWGYVEPTGTDTPVFWPVTWRFTGAQAQYFRRWFVYALKRGTLTMTLPIRTEFGLVAHECQFLPDSLLPARQLATDVWEYSATIMARSTPVEGYEVDLDGVTNCGSTSAVGVLLTGLDASATYTISQPPGRLYAGYSAWPTDDSALPPTTPDDEKWGNAFCATKFPGADVNNVDARSTNFGIDRGYETGELARAAFAVATITGSAEYKFWISDGSPTDNRGGISLLILRAP